jgi:hypothetical protein
MKLNHFKKVINVSFGILLILIFIVGCKNIKNQNNDNPPKNDDPEPTEYPTQLLQPEDFTYLGAFRLPGGSNGSNWEYSGSAMAYYPNGDPNGSDDGFPGSIYSVGHDWLMFVSEITIPVPVLSQDKNPNDLSCATTLQGFKNVRTGIGQLEQFQEIIRVGMEYLPKQGSQTSGKIYMSWGQHLQEEDENFASHMWCDLNLTNSQGAWQVGDYSLYSANDYMFEIPKAWSEDYTPGMRLATGRFRDGGWSGQGPSIFAIGPWNHGNPPPNDFAIDAIPLLLYSSSYVEDSTAHKMSNYHHSDEWSGGAWLTTDDKSAIIFVGTKGFGNCWYGNPDGPCLECDDRGWWSDSFKAQIIFYDPSDIAAVAKGEKQPYEPQPYASMIIDPFLFHITSQQQVNHVRAVCFDPSRKILYIIEPLADGDKSIVHAWKVEN